MNVDRERTKILGALIEPSLARAWIFDESSILLCDTVVVEMRSFEQPVWKVRDICFDNFEHTRVRHVWAIC